MAREVEDEFVPDATVADEFEAVMLASGVFVTEVLVPVVLVGESDVDILAAAGLRAVVLAPVEFSKEVLSDVLLLIAVLLSAEELGVAEALDREAVEDSVWFPLLAGGKVVPLAFPEEVGDASVTVVELFPSIALELSFPSCEDFPVPAVVEELLRLLVLELSPPPKDVGFSLPAFVVALSFPAILSFPPVVFEFALSFDVVDLSLTPAIVELTFSTEEDLPPAPVVVDFSLSFDIVDLSLPSVVVELSFPAEDLSPPPPDDDLSLPTVVEELPFSAEDLSPPPDDDSSLPTVVAGVPFPAEDLSSPPAVVDFSLSPLIVVLSFPAEGFSPPPDVVVLSLPPVVEELSLLPDDLSPPPDVVALSLSIFVVVELSLPNADLSLPPAVVAFSPPSFVVEL